MRFGKNAVDKGQLRRLAVSAMGDFVGLSPTERGDIPSDITALGVHPQGDLIAVGLDNGEIRLIKPIDKTLGDSAGDSPRQSSSIVGLEFSTTGDLLISVDREGTLRFHNFTATDGWKESHAIMVDAGENGIESVQLTPGQTNLVTHNQSVVTLSI